MLGQIDHIDIVVADPQAMASFLESLGFVRLRDTGGGRGSVELRCPGDGDQPFIELTPANTGTGVNRPLGLRHIALRASDLDSAFAALSDKGYLTDAPPREIAATGRRLFNLTDPEGNSLQVVSAPE
jgi:glyoxylase I family protein